MPCFALGKAIDVTDLEDDDCEKEEGQLLQIQNNKMQPDRQNEHIRCRTARGRATRGRSFN